MIELRFDDTLYDGFAIDEVAKAFEPFATIERERPAGAFLLRITRLAGDADAPSEADIAAELANHALGKTIEKRSGAQ
ncbi:MAG TPA: HxsD-like protein [Polyangiaceae bacterium]|nr:HxsD-like protein [Polyangiaceae bacterium]